MKNIILIVLVCIFYTNSYAQQNIIDDLFGERREIYFRFANADAIEKNVKSTWISIDKIDKDYTYAYANKNQFSSFYKLQIPFEKLTPPSLLVPESEIVMKDVITLKKGEKATWNYFPTYSAYLSLMQQFKTNYPNICKIDTIGTSVEGRLLLVAKISDNVNTDESEPEFFYTSSMHGDETTGYVLLLHFIDYLLSNYGTIPRITNIVNNMEIYINPLANPDGTFASGNNSVSGATRSNANGTDLNRNYPVPDGSTGDDGTYSKEVETQAFIDFIESRHFVMSANFHGGIELANYCWDYTGTRHADDAWWKYVAKEYADTCQFNSPSGYFEAEPSMYVGTADYPGVVHGYSWYPAPGSRQDYSVYFAQCRELTLEISDIKNPSASSLESFWNYNYKSMLNYLEQAQYGIRGIVKDNCTGNPIKALITINSHDKDSSMVFSDDVHGTYYRPIASGTWSITVSAHGYTPQTITGVSTANKTFVTKNFSLNPLAPQANFTASDSISCSGTINFYSIGSYPSDATFSWNFGDGNTSTEQNPTHNYTANGTYTVTLDVTSCAGNSTKTKNSYIKVEAPEIPVANNVSACYGNTATLNASASNTINWYDSPYGGNLLGTGNTYTTPALNATTTYYVENYTPGQNLHTGPTVSGDARNIEAYLIFDVYNPIKLISVDAQSTSPGNKIILLQDESGNTIKSKNVYVNNSITTINLDWEIQPGTNYRLTNLASTNLIRKKGGLSYPYKAGNLMSIISSSEGNDYYYSWFNWHVEGIGCNSARIPVVVSITPAASAAFSSEINEKVVTFTNNSSNATSYNWNFGDGSTSTEENPVHTYAAFGTYNVELTATNDCGSNKSTQSITLINAVNNFNSSFSIFPNPVQNNYATIEFTANVNENFSIKIISIEGKIIYEENIEANAGKNSININFSNIEKGIYLVEISSKTEIRKIQLVK